MSRIAIFASGRGSNAKKIIEHFKSNETKKIALIISNKEDAPVLDVARANKIDYLVLNRKQFYETSSLLTQLEQYAIDFIVLAGFLWLIPPYLVTAYDKRMINIHPALLPKYGGKGMYGMHVHRAVKADEEQESGITIHFVNQVYDEGAIIFQASTKIDPTDSPEDIASKVQQLEHKHFAPIIDNLLDELNEPIN